MLSPSEIEQDQNDESEPDTSAASTPDVVDIEETPAQVETASQSSDEPSPDELDDSPEEAPVAPPEPPGQPPEAVDSLKYSQKSARRWLQRPEHCGAVRIASETADRLAGPCA